MKRIRTAFGLFFRVLAGRPIAVVHIRLDQREIARAIRQG